MSLYEGGELTFRMDGEYQINYLTQHPKVFNESELEKERIEDTLFPLHELGYVYKATDDGKIHLRVYSHGMLYVKVDGEYEGKTVLDAAEVLLNEWIPSDAFLHADEQVHLFVSAVARTIACCRSRHQSNSVVGIALSQGTKQFAFSRDGIAAGVQELFADDDFLGHEVDFAVTVVRHRGHSFCFSYSGLRCFPHPVAI